MYGKIKTEDVNRSRKVAFSMRYPRPVEIVGVKLNELKIINWLKELGKKKKMVLLP